MKLFLVRPKDKEMTTERICVVAHKFYDSLSWDGRVICHINADDLSVNEQNSNDT